MIFVRFQGKPFSVTVIQVYAPTSNAEEAEVERLYENLRDLLELWRHLVTWGAGFIWEELENKGLQTQEAWRELRWRQARRSLNESGQRPIWNAGSKKLLPVVWDFSFWEGSMSDGRWFCPLFPPSLQQTRIEALKYRSESGMKPSPHRSPHSPGKEASRDLLLIALES